MIFSSTMVSLKRILDVLCVDDLAPGIAAGRRGNDELHALVRGVHQQQEAVVDHPFAIFIRHLQRLPVEHQPDGAASIRSSTLHRRTSLPSVLNHAMSRIDAHQ